MRRIGQLQGLRLMKFDEVYGRTYRSELSQLEAAEILGMSERTFRRWRDRFEAEGAAGLYDRRLDRVSARRAGVDPGSTRSQHRWIYSIPSTGITPPGTSGRSCLESMTSSCQMAHYTTPAVYKVVLRFDQIRLQVSAAVSGWCKIRFLN